MILTRARAVPGRTRAVAVLVLAVLGHAVVLAIWPQAHTLLIDLQVYRAGGEHVLRGEPLYAGGVLLALATVAVVTARPGPGVGPIPSTGLISLFPDAYLLLFVLLLAGLVGLPGLLDPPPDPANGTVARQVCARVPFAAGTSRARRRPRRWSGGAFVR